MSTECCLAQTALAVWLQCLSWLDLNPGHVPHHLQGAALLDLAAR